MMSCPIPPRSERSGALLLAESCFIAVDHEGLVFVASLCLRNDLGCNQRRTLEGGDRRNLVAQSDLVIVKVGMVENEREP